MPSSSWSLHYLNARDAVAPFKDRVDRACLNVERRAKDVCGPIALDTVVQAIPGRGIPAIGHVGHSLSPGIVTLTLDPDNPHFEADLGEPLERTLAHELHHAMRWDEVGYGLTLGEAIVTEGLARRFVQELYGRDGEIWERAVSREERPPFAERACRQFDDENYDHHAWFFGTGDLPCWLGWEIVGHYLRAHDGTRPSRLAGKPEDTFLPSLDALAEI